MIRDFGSVEFLYLLAAMRWTLGLSVLAFVCGGIVGLVLALARKGADDPLDPPTCSTDPLPAPRT
ncbi:hypothetical protein ET532_001390 [Verminephrobacter sp. Larva24]|nr:hypothetical protein ET532_001390 [Verminephrobacter sp. Larva24]